MIIVAQVIIDTLKKIMDAYRKIGFFMTMSLILVGAGFTGFVCKKWPEYFYSEELAQLPPLKEEHKKLSNAYSKAIKDLNERNFAYNKLQAALTEQKLDSGKITGQLYTEKIALQSENKALRNDNETLNKRLNKPTEKEVADMVRKIAPETKLLDLRYVSEIYIGQKKSIFNTMIAISAEEAPNGSSIPIPWDNRCKLIVESASGYRVEEIFEKKDQQINIPLAGTTYRVTLHSEEKGKCTFSYVQTRMQPRPR